MGYLTHGTTAGGKTYDLLFCPFCGGEAHIKEVVSACETLYTIGCSDSGCMGYETWLLKPTVDEAVAAWNRRAERICHDVSCHDISPDAGWFQCSECGAFVGECGVTNAMSPIPITFCPNCGAWVMNDARIDSYRLQCRKCRHVKKHTRVYIDGTRVYMGFVCTHPARLQGVYVNPDDCPYNPCASENARRCPLKWSDG